MLKMVPTNCIMTNGGPNIAGACRLGTSNSVATNFASTPKQAEQHDNDQALSVSTQKKTVSEVWLDAKRAILIAIHFLQGCEQFFFFLNNHIQHDQEMHICLNIGHFFYEPKLRAENSVWRHDMFERPHY